MPLASISMRGRQSEWGVNWQASQEQIDAMREDGIEVNIICNTIPLWVAELGYYPIRSWCLLQDLWNFKNPFKGA